MNEDIYTKLLDRINENFAKRPATPGVLNFLRELFTEEQAELAASMPLGAHTVKSLAQQLNRDEAKLENILEAMADEGIMFVAKTENNESEYSVPPFAPGFTELQHMRKEVNERTKRIYQLMIEMGRESSAQAEELYKDDKNIEAANKRLRNPGLRTLAVEEELPDNIEIATWERISEFLASEDSFAIGNCACRHGAEFRGEPCKVEGVPMESCVYFGKMADFMVDRNFGKRASKEEVLDLLKVCEEKGLVHNINNFLGPNIVFCSCCGCCCGYMKSMIKYRGLNTVAKSNFMAVVDKETCTGCETCVDLCQVEAITMDDDDVATINQDYCIGCGSCVAQCPEESLSLVRCADSKPPYQTSRVVGIGV